MKELWHKLNLDPSGALRDDLDLSFVEGPDPQNEWTWGAYSDELKDIFNEDWLDYMESKNCRPDNVVIFYKPVNCRDNIHIDYRPNKQFTQIAINLIANPGYVSGTGAHKKYKDWKDNATMRWYETDVHKHQPIQGVAKPKPGSTVGYSYDYIRVPEDESVKEIHSTIFNDGIYLSNSLIPHQVVTTNQPRLCFSLRGCVEPQPSWEDLVRHLGDIGLL